VIRDSPQELMEVINLTPWSRVEYKKSYEITNEPLEDARRFMVRTWMAIGTKTSDKTGWANHIKPVDSGVSRWRKLDKNILIATERLQHDKCNIVQIENMDAIKLIERYNRPYVFIYADPPYPIKTRSKRIYKHEMTDDDHLKLLDVLLNHKGPVMISTYENELYNDKLKNWHKEHRTAKTEMGGNAIETIYMNYENKNKQISMFEVDKESEGE
jgi:DNA adenine methylase